jgi:hypothetical protein
MHLLVHCEQWQDERDKQEHGRLQRILACVGVFVRQFERYLLMGTLPPHDAYRIQQQQQVIESDPEEKTADDDHEGRVDGTKEAEAPEAKGGAHNHAKRKFDQYKPGPMEDDVEGSNFPYSDKSFAFDGILLPLRHMILHLLFCCCKIANEAIAAPLISLEKTDKKPRLDNHVNQGMADDNRGQTAFAYDIGNGEGNAEQKGQSLHSQNSE